MGGGACADSTEPGLKSEARRADWPAYTPRHTKEPFAMHFDAHQPVIDDLEARIVTIRDSL